MQLFLVISYFVIILLFVTPVPLGIRLVFNNYDRKVTILIKVFNRNTHLPKPKKKKEKQKKSRIGFKFMLKNINLSKIMVENFKLEIASPKEISPIVNYSLFFLLNTVDDMLSRTNYNWYRDRSYISYVITDKKQVYLQFKADIKINLYIIFFTFFQTIKIYWRNNGSN